MANNIKFTLEEVKQEFTNRGYIPLFDKYNGTLMKLEAKTLEGYRFFISLSKLKLGQTPRFFSKNNSHTIENIKLYLKLTNSPYTLVSKEFKSACKDKLVFVCPEHGDFESNWNGIQQRGSGCYECRNEKISKVKSMTLEEIKLRLKIIAPNIEILNDEYSSMCKIKCKCLKCGNIWRTVWGNLQQGKNCIECFKNHQKGINHPNWKGGISPIHEYLRGHMKKWREDSLENNNYRCDVTGDQDDLVVHHLYNFSDIVRETLETLKLSLHENLQNYTEVELEKLKTTCLSLHYKYGLGVCIRSDIHDEFHSIYGKSRNTKFQYEQFKKEKQIILQNQATFS